MEMSKLIIHSSLLDIVRVKKIDFTHLRKTSWSEGFRFISVVKTSRIAIGRIIICFETVHGFSTVGLFAVGHFTVTKKC